MKAQAVASAEPRDIEMPKMLQRRRRCDGAPAKKPKAPESRRFGRNLWRSPRWADRPVIKEALKNCSFGAGILWPAVENAASGGGPARFHRKKNRQWDRPQRDRHADDHRKPGGKSRQLKIRCGYLPMLFQPARRPERSANV